MTKPSLNAEEIENMRPRLIEAVKSAGFRTVNDEINALCDQAILAIRKAPPHDPHRQERGMSETYSIHGPICPHCGHKHMADEPHYFDEDLTELDCEKCDKNFAVRVYRSTSWTCAKDHNEL